MNKVFFLSALTIIFLVPVAQAMEKENPINLNVFTQQDKEYMQARVALWANTARMSGSTTGLGAILNSIDIGGIEHLINDQTALKEANTLYNEMSTCEYKLIVETFKFFDCEPNIKIIKDRNHTSYENVGQASYFKGLLLVSGYVKHINNIEQPTSILLDVQQNQEDGVCAII